MTRYPLSELSYVKAYTYTKPQPIPHINIHINTHIKHIIRDMKI